MDIFQKAVDDREERVRDLHLDMPLPTWDGDMVVRFDILGREVIEKFANATKRTPEMDLDFVLKATREIYIHDPEHAAEGEVLRMPENDDYILLQSETGLPVKFDQLLAEKLRQGQLTKARDILLFCVKGNMIAIGGLATKLINWMQNTDAEVAGQLVGESSASTI